MEHKYRGLSFGVFLLTLGIIWILFNTGVITWSIIDSLFVLWPLIFVIIGVNIIFRRNGLVRAGAWVLFLAVVISYSYFIEDKGHPGQNFTTGDSVSIERLAETNNADLSLRLGSTKINLDSGTDKLLEASLHDNQIRHSSELQENNSKAYIVFEKNRYSFGDISFNNNAGSSFHLNKDVIWNLDLNMGAIDGNFDMSNLKVANLGLNIGAASARLIMGNFDTKVNINGGASKITIDLPLNAGIKVKIDGGLNNTNMNMPGWEKRDSWYYSPDYDTKQFKLEANVTMGVGSLTVNTVA